MDISHRPPHDIRDIPEGNILDLRKVTSLQRQPKSDDALREFWSKKEKKRVHESVRPSRQKSGMVRSRSDFSLRHMLQAWWASFRSWRPGSFPAVALGVLLVVAGIASIGSLFNVQSKVIAIARTGIDSVKTASARAATRDMSGAASSLTEATDTFSRAEKEFASIHPVIQQILRWLPYAGSKYSSGQHLLAAARQLSAAAADVATIAGPLENQANGFSGPASLVERLQQDRATQDRVMKEVEGALNDLEQVNPGDVPSEYREAIEQVRIAIPGLRASIASLTDATAVLADLLGTDQPREHLFVFQNSNELRPTGGFIGSFALIRMDNGEFHILDAPDKGSFGVDEYLPKTITPPTPLQVITPSWFFRDANWYPDFPTSAKQLSSMYEQARGFAPRGVIAVTNGFLERALEVTGPINLPQYQVTVDASNITAVAQEQVEKKYDLRTNDPKRFVVDLIPVIATKLSALDVRSYPKFLAVVAESVSRGDLQIWSDDQQMQDTIVRLGWSGKLPEYSNDGFELVDTNIGGGKTDDVIAKTVEETLRVDDDGTVTAQVMVTMKHNGVPGDPFSGSRNRTYHRYYLPQGARFISAQGFDRIPVTAYQVLPVGTAANDLLREEEGRVIVDEQTGTRINDEFGHTVFGNWTEIDPGQTKTMSMTFVLPKKFGDGLARYDLKIGKQAGVKELAYTLNVVLPESGSISWVSDSTATTKKNIVTWSSRIVRPVVFSFVGRLKKQ